MPTKTVNIPTYVSELEKALKRKLHGVKVYHEKLQKDRYRFIVVWSKFNNVDHAKRQRRVWEIADETLNDKKDLLRVGMILTMAPSELATV